MHARQVRARETFPAWIVLNREPVTREGVDFIHVQWDSSKKIELVRKDEIEYGGRRRRSKTPPRAPLASKSEDSDETNPPPPPKRIRFMGGRKSAPKVPPLRPQPENPAPLAAKSESVDTGDDSSNEDAAAGVFREGLFFQIERTGEKHFYKVDHTQNGRVVARRVLNIIYNNDLEDITDLLRAENGDLQKTLVFGCCTFL